MNNSSAHLLAQHGELLQVGAVFAGQPLQDRSGRFLMALGCAVLCIAIAAGAGHVTQGIHEENARVAAAKAAEEARVAEEKRIAAIQVAGLQQRLSKLQVHISTQRDLVLKDIQGVIADGEQFPAVAETLRRYPAPYKPLQGIDPVAFEAFIDIDRESWISAGTSPELDKHYKTELAKLKLASDYLDNFEEAVKHIAQGKPLPSSMRYERFAAGFKTETRELKDPVSPAKPEALRFVPDVPVAPEPVMPLETPAASAPAEPLAPAPAAKPRTVPTGVPGKVQVLDW